MIVYCCLSPSQHEFGVFALHMLIHQLQQQRSHDVCVILQLAVQRHSQQGGKRTPRTGTEVRAALQRVDELQEDRMPDFISG